MAEGRKGAVSWDVDVVPVVSLSHAVAKRSSWPK